MSVAILERFAAEGVTQVVCTPHLDASRAADAPVDAHRQLLATLQAAVPAITLHRGWEIMLDIPGVALDRPGLALGDSRAVLVEFSRGGVPRGAVAELRRLVRCGLVPILAHPERYYGCTVALVQELSTAGVVIQTDASVLTSRGTPGILARDLLAQGLIHILASDNHGDRRSLAAGAAWLREQGATPEQVQLLTNDNAARVLADEAPTPVPPLVAGSFLERISRRLTR